MDTSYSSNICENKLAKTEVVTLTAILILTGTLLDCLGPWEHITILIMSHDLTVQNTPGHLQVQHLCTHMNAEPWYHICMQASHSVDIENFTNWDYINILDYTNNCTIGYIVNNPPQSA